jgi:cytochrome c2
MAEKFCMRLGEVISFSQDEPTLDRWLSDPGALVPGTKMFYNVQSSQDRADIIAYLKQQN